MSDLCPATSRKLTVVEPKRTQSNLQTVQCPLCERWFEARKLQTGEWAWPRHTITQYIQHRSSSTDARTVGNRTTELERDLSKRLRRMEDEETFKKYQRYYRGVKDDEL